MRPREAEEIQKYIYVTIWACSKILVNDCGAFTAKLLALREALELIDDLGLVVKYEGSDCSNAVHIINNSHDFSYKDLIACDISKILKNSSGGSCRFVPEKGIRQPIHWPKLA